MRRRTLVLLAIAAGFAIPILVGSAASAATPRTPAEPRVPRSKQVDRAPAVRRGPMRGGLLSLGSPSGSSTSVERPKPQRRIRPRGEVRSASSEDLRPSRQVVVRSASTQTTRTTHDASVSRRVAAVWPGDDRKALRVASCESGMRPGATSSSGRYRGLFQFDQQTWRSVGGRGSPGDASVEEQTRRAWKLKQQRGWAPWPVCGRA